MHSLHRQSVTCFQYHRKSPSETIDMSRWMRLPCGKVSKWGKLERSGRKETKWLQTCSPNQMLRTKIIASLSTLVVFSSNSTELHGTVVQNISYDGFNSPRRSTEAHCTVFWMKFSKLFSSQKRSRWKRFPNRSRAHGAFFAGLESNLDGSQLK